jgi:hypothetical protein
MSNQELDFIKDLLLKIDERLDAMERIQIRHEANLVEHMKRSRQLEEEFKPLQKHIHMVQGVGAFIGIIALVVSIFVVFKG